MPILLCRRSLKTSNTAFAFLSFCPYDLFSRYAFSREREKFDSRAPRFYLRSRWTRSSIEPWSTITRYPRRSKLPRSGTSTGVMRNVEESTCPSLRHRKPRDVKESYDSTHFVDSLAESFSNRCIVTYVCIRSS